MPALQETFNHFDAWPSSLTGIPFFILYPLNAKPG